MASEHATTAAGTRAARGRRTLRREVAEHRRPAGRRAGLRAPCGATAPSPSTTTGATSGRWTDCSAPSPPRAAHTSRRPLRPGEFAEYCAEPRPRPGHRGQPHPLHRANSPRTGAALPYAGQPARPNSCPQLIDEAVRQATWEYATHAPGRRRAPAPTAARTSAGPPSTAPRRLLDRICSNGAGPGAPPPRLQHPGAGRTAPRGPARWTGRRRRPGPARRVREPWTSCTVLAAGLALDSPGGVVLRTSPAPAPRTASTAGACAASSLAPLTAGRGLQRLLHRRRHRRTRLPGAGRRVLRAGFDLGRPDPTARRHHR